MLVRINDWIIKGMLVAAATLAFLLCFVVVADVLGRDLFSRPVKGTKEIVEASIVIVCFLQAAYAIRSGGMISADAFVSTMPKPVRTAFAIISALLGATFFALVCWGSVGPAVHAWSSNEFEGEGALRIPSWPARFVVVIGTALAALQYLISAWQQVQTLRGGSRGEAPPARVH
jgi:TRAP-type C4-dicarboxylate transport system permease small subunit